MPDEETIFNLMEMSIFLNMSENSQRNHKTIMDNANEINDIFLKKYGHDFKFPKLINDMFVVAYMSGQDDMKLKMEKNDE